MFRFAALVLGMAFASVSIAQSLRPDPPFYGIGRAKDGDSLMVGEREVRLFGIDAPELGQTCNRAGQSWSCGAEAAQELRRLVGGQDVRCVRVTTNKYGRAVSRCTVGSTDINSAMVESGYATAFRQYSGDYIAAEAQAKAGKLGLWSGTFENPQKYRAEEFGQIANRAVERARPVERRPSRDRQTTDPSSCRIKGNQNRRGQWIYHLPGMPYYEQTRAEQIFCSEAEARAAGYRRAIVR